jgi:hypothetical protein
MPPTKIAHFVLFCSSRNAAMSGAKKAVSYFRLAGMNYLEYISLSSTALRKVLKEPQRSEALSRSAFKYREFTYAADGKESAPSECAGGENDNAPPGGEARAGAARRARARASAQRERDGPHTHDEWGRPRVSRVPLLRAQWPVHRRVVTRGRAGSSRLAHKIRREHARSASRRRACARQWRKRKSGQGRLPLSSALPRAHAPAGVRLASRACAGSMLPGLQEHARVCRKAARSSRQVTRIALSRPLSVPPLTRPPPLSPPSPLPAAEFYSDPSMAPKK